MFLQIFHKPSCVRVLCAACAAMVLEWSFGGSGFKEADAMVRAHFSISCSNSYVDNFVSYLVVGVTSLRELWYPEYFTP